MNDEVVSSFCIYEMVGVIMDFLQEADNQILVKLFALSIISAFDKTNHTGLEGLYFSPAWLYS